MTMLPDEGCCEYCEEGKGDGCLEGDEEEVRTRSDHRGEAADVDSLSSAAGRDPGPPLS